MFSRVSRSEDFTSFSVLGLMLDSPWNQKVMWGLNASSLSMPHLDCLKPTGVWNINYPCTWYDLFVGSSSGLKILAWAILLDPLSRKGWKFVFPILHYSDSLLVCLDFLCPRNIHLFLVPVSVLCSRCGPIWHALLYLAIQMSTPGVSRQGLHCFCSQLYQ